MSKQVLEMMATSWSIEQINQMYAQNPAIVLDDGSVVLPPSRLSFPALLNKRKADDGTETSWGASLLFVGLPGVLKEFVGVVNQVLAREFPHLPAGYNGFKYPTVRDQGAKVSPQQGGTNPTGKTTGGHVPGFPMLVTTARNYRPNYFMSPFINGQPSVCPDTDIEKVFYPGCWVRATVKPFASKKGTNQGIFNGLQALLKIADDTKFADGGGGGVSPSVYAGAQVMASPNVAFAQPAPQAAPGGFAAQPAAAPVAQPTTPPWG